MMNIDVLIEIAGQLSWNTWALLVGALAMLGFSIWEFTKANSMKNDFDNPNPNVSVNAALNFLGLRTDAHFSVVFFVIFMIVFFADVDEAFAYMQMQTMAEQTNTAIESLHQRIEALEDGESGFVQPTFQNEEDYSV